MYCVGTNPAGEQRKREFLEETYQKTAFKMTAKVIWDGRMRYWRFQCKTTRDIGVINSIPYGRSRLFEWSFKTFKENRKESRAFDDVPYGCMRLSERSYDILDRKNKLPALDDVPCGCRHPFQRSYEVCTNACKLIG